MSRAVVLASLYLAHIATLMCHRFIGAHVVKQLLEAGYCVRGTVRDHTKTEKVAFLHQLAEGSPGSLELVSADLNKPDTFLPAVDGCDFVMHVASPYSLTVEDPQRDLVSPAVTGTLAVLEAAQAATQRSVRRIVLTSSMAAVTDEPVNGHLYTERDWNVRSSLERSPYYYSKVCAERAAWRFVEEHAPGWDLVTMNPFGVWGPSLGPGLNTTNNIVKSVATGQFPVVLGLCNVFTDVRDVAAAHVAAMTTPHANGRYLMALQEPKPLHDMCQDLQALGLQGDGYAIPTTRCDGACGVWCTKYCLAHAESGGTKSFLQTNPGTVLSAECVKARVELGLVPIPYQQSLVDTVADMLRQGHLPPCPAAQVQDAVSPAAPTEASRPEQGIPRELDAEELEQYYRRSELSVPVPELGSEPCCGGCCVCCCGAPKSAPGPTTAERKDR